MSKETLEKREVLRAKMQAGIQEFLEFNRTFGADTINRATKECVDAAFDVALVMLHEICIQNEKLSSRMSAMDRVMSK